MSELVFASQMMHEVIAPPGAAPSKGERVRLAARRLKWKFSRARDVWYADPRVSIKPRELRQVEEISGVKFGREEAREVDRLIARADALLMGKNEGADSALVAALRAFVRALDCTGTSGDSR